MGEDFPVWCRLNARELGIENGLSLEEALEIATLVEGSGVDAMSVSAFGYGKFEDTIKPEKEGALLPFAEAFKKRVSKPIMAAGMITPALGEQALRNGQADLVVLGRALIADPELPQKVVRGEEEDIRPCILCYWCDDSRSSGGSIRCLVNPATGREGEYVIRPTKEVKDVFIVGGGPAGMEAGRVAALRGHRVRIYEKDERLGGQLRFASVPPHKERLEKLNDYFINQLNNKIPQYSGGPNSRAYFAKPGPIKPIPIHPNVPAMNEPIAAIHNACPPLPCRVIWNPSMHVTTEAGSPGIFTMILVVDPPYIAP